MKRIRFAPLLVGLYLTSTALYAALPVVSHNVHVLKNATHAQCPSTWDGREAPDTVSVAAGYGMGTFITSPIIRSCTSCEIDNSTSDCVCGTCYDYSE